MSEKTPSSDEEALLNYSREGTKIYAMIKDKLGTEFKVYEKTPAEWRSYFSLEIPADPTPQDINRLSSQLMEQFQIASFYCAMSELVCDAIKSSNDNYYNDQYTKIVNNFLQNNPDKRLPAADTIKALTEGSMNAITSATAHAEGIAKFWKQIVRSLDSNKKLLEIMTWNISTERKVTQSQFSS